MSLVPSAPEPHNLLGIWFDINGNEDTARRHFRAAYSLDPTYKPACNNLEQICAMFQYSQKPSYDFGDEPKDGSASK
jgi:Flp pilus assembly protein TadD